MNALRRGPQSGRWIFPAIVAVAVVTGALAANNASPVGLWVFLFVLAGWVISLCLHEFAHAVVALSGGDESVRSRGYLTLNPLRYTNPVYSIVIPIVLLAIGGIPLPGGAVLVERHRLRSRAWMSLVSAAGPLTNLVLAILCTFASAALITTSGSGSSVTTALGAAVAFLAVLQFLTAILNVLPVPGFDGFGILEPHLSPNTQRAVAPFRPWAPLVVFALLFTVPEVAQALFTPAFALYDFFGGSRGAAQLGQQLFLFWR